MSPSYKIRHRKDYDAIVHWLEVHFPFSYKDHESLVCIANGAVGSKNVNADNAFSLSVKAFQI